MIFAPNVLECKLAVAREKAAKLARLAIVAMGMTDGDIPNLYDILNHSECDIEELDLSFNRLTDKGLMELCVVLGREGMMAHALNSLCVGGNDITAEGLLHAGQLLEKQRPDVTLSAEPLMKDAIALMHVGKVFEDSPAWHAGLKKGDVILAFGARCYNGRRKNAGFKTDEERQMDILQHFEDIETSVKPLVADAVDAQGINKKAIDVVVARLQAGHLRCTLRPAKWSGAGLLGAKLSAVALDGPSKPAPPGSKLAEAKA